MRPEAEVATSPFRSLWTLRCRPKTPGMNRLVSPGAQGFRGDVVNTLPDKDDLEVVTRFLLRFADLMSTGSNSDNLLRAARLLESNVKRADDAEKLLLEERANCATLTTQLAAALSQEDHVRVPISILRLATSQFEALAREFEKSGNVVSEAMCTASASTLERFLEARTIPGRDQTEGPKDRVGN